MIQTQDKGMNESIAIAREQRCNKFVNAAIQYQNRKDVFRLSLCLQTINNEKLYLERGYKTVYDLSKDILGVTKVSTSNYLNVAKKFLNSNTGTSIYADESGDFSFSQLVELKRLSVDDVNELISNGIISKDSTVRELKDIVATAKDKAKEEQKKKEEESLKPLTEAYENFHTAFNRLKELVISNDEVSECMQTIMDSVVLLYNENDRLWR